LEEVQAVESFAEALKERGEQIFKRCESPREVRRFLNYLRLIVTASSSDQEGGIEALREKYPGTVDRDLVDLASQGDIRATGPEGMAVQE
jgi:hypothetical protein